jgi:hypothetical protein
VPSSSSFQPLIKPGAPDYTTTQVTVTPPAGQYVAGEEVQFTAILQDAYSNALGTGSTGLSLFLTAPNGTVRQVSMQELGNGTAVIKVP